LSSNKNVGYTYLNSLGVILIIVGVAIVSPSILAWFYDDMFQIFVFMTLGVTVGIIGFIIFHIHKGNGREPSVSGAMIFSAAVYLLIPLIGAIPIFTISKMSFVDSYFEAMSGFTTTGLTMFTNVENLPKSILFWRSLMQWIGGIGVIILMLTILARPGMAAARLYAAEGRTEKLVATIAGTVKRTWWIYVLYTGVGVVLLYLAGMPLFDALNHSMAAIATGGFSVKNAGIGAYNSSAIEACTLLVMMLGMTSFAVHYQVFCRGVREFFRNTEVRVMFIFITAFSIFIFSILLVKTSIPLFIGVRQSVFQCISALSTTGNSTVNISAWDESTKTLLIMLMVIGGGYGSTSGGIKLIRVATILVSLRWIVRKLMSPRGTMISPKLWGKVYDEAEVVDAMRYSLLYFILLVGCSVLMTTLGFSLIDSLFEVASAQGTVGLSVGVTSPNLHFIGKLILIIEMWAGRLEILPAILLFQPIFTPKKAR